MKNGLSVLIVALGITGLLGFAAIPSSAEEVILLPSDINIITPSPDLPKELAAFSGRWEGKWDGYLKSILIIEEINEKEAKIIYAVDDQPRYNIKASCRRYVAKVILTPGKRPGIEFNSGKGTTFSFDIQKDLSTLEGLRFNQTSYVASAKASCKMKRSN